MTGQRLDRVLLALWPDSSLRRRRRAFEAGAVLVDGAARRPGYKVRAGQRVCVEPAVQESRLRPGDVAVTADDGRFAAVAKPAGAHSASVAGSPHRAVEALLPDLFPGRDPLLANRLDQATSGLLIVAFGAEALDQHRRWEDQGRVEKRYLAWVRGELDAPAALDRELDTAGGPRVRVLDRPASDPLRITEVAVLRRCEGLALVEAVIRKGARHQIRAHLAAAGLPILGDELYGESEPGGMRLHHARVRSPGLEACCDPPWQAL
jgi:23S rRNA pseudouridine1911/1915/1917 synthase